MTEFYVTNAWRKNCEGEWIEAESETAALIIAHNRVKPGSMHAKAKASHYSSGHIVDVSMGDFMIVGLRAEVIR